MPVLVDGDEVIHDSKRILQYLDWKYGRENADSDLDEADPDEEDSDDAR